MSTGKLSSTRRIKAAVRGVTEVLRGLDRLDYLHLKLLVSKYRRPPPFPWSSRQFFRDLEGFAALRNVGTVVLDGVQPEYGQYLTKTMTGCSPLDYLPKMYEALKLYAGPFDCCALILREACDAMEMDDVERFKHVRERLITMVTNHPIEAEAHLFDHDASTP